MLDGPDGCGKSTQAQLLRGWLEAGGTSVETFRDPGTTVIGEKVREILLDPSHEVMDVRCEMLLYMAARAQLWAESIAPALAEGKCVLMDRWVSSTCAYQGCAGGFGVDRVIALAEIALERVWPDLTVVLDVDTRTAAGRLNRSLDRMELKGLEYHEKVRVGFLQLAEHRHVVVVDAGGPLKYVQERITAVLQERF